MNKIFSIIGIIAVLFVSVQYADAVEILLEGESKNHGIFIAIQGNDNIMMWDTVDGYSEYFDSKQKIYKSGGFSLKNPESGIAVWGHPINDVQYKLVILTNEGIVRMVGNVITNNDIDTKQDDTSTHPIRIEPKSSVGADITKYDVPTITRDDKKTSMLLTLKTNPITSFLHGDRYDMNGKILDVRTGKILEGAEITVQISRDGYVIRELDDISSKAGTVRLQFNNMSYPEFYPSFCYQVKAEIKYGNVTSTWKDDFNISNVRAGTLDFSWLEQAQWGYLPNSFREIPPVFLTADKKCNGV